VLDAARGEWVARGNEIRGQTREGLRLKRSGNRWRFGAVRKLQATVLPDKVS
jgi:hypothetical protein